MASGEGIGKLAKFRALSVSEQWLIVRAALWLLIARIMIALMPFEKLAQRLSVEDGSEPVDVDQDLLGRIGYAVSVAAAHVPWRSDCFPQTIAARMLLNGYDHPSAIHLGVDRVGDSELAGHAWLTCGGIVVVGGADLDRYTEVHRLN